MPKSDPFACIDVRRIQTPVWQIMDFQTSDLDPEEALKRKRDAQLCYVFHVLVTVIEHRLRGNGDEF